MVKLTKSDLEALSLVASNLGVRSEWLQRIILKESGNNPSIWSRTPYNKYRVDKYGESPKFAKGLIQFTDETAKGLGFKDSLDLITQYPSFTSQLLGPVARYFRGLGPFPTKQSFYLAVFYPKARTWPTHQEFPPNVQASNKPIKTVQDYIDFVDGKAIKVVSSGAAALALLVIFFLISSRKGH